MTITKDVLCLYVRILLIVLKKTKQIINTCLGIFAMFETRNLFGIFV